MALSFRLRAALALRSALNCAGVALRFRPLTLVLRRFLAFAITFSFDFSRLVFQAFLAAALFFFPPRFLPRFFIPVCPGLMPIPISLGSAISMPGCQSFNLNRLARRLSFLGGFIRKGSNRPAITHTSFPDVYPLITPAQIQVSL